ncbi:uncharacterized protein BHQ10_000691 [Talaromyces amestolkiae]|uniref:Uncharacterized protein n=1 Tax=Talaromyces amestolkiae TaxID=1196081 RepID=A0A364KMA2_TALAM|nr:uncharacterized protein BHQ10_000691 [Talaromyces amestolkiae]RAO64679.1 hypothetical protein BHQ10_000691 [Talaromyces amestolkiae]
MAIKNRALSSELLSPVAEEVWKPIFEVARTSKPPSSEGANIAIHLHLVAEAFKRQSLYHLTSEIQRQCDLVLRDIFNICTWPLSSSSYHNPKETSAQYLYTELSRKFRHQPVQDEMINSISKFLLQGRSLIRRYSQRLENLSVELDRIDQNDADESAVSSQYLSPRNGDEYPDHVNRYLIDALKEHSTCYPESHAVKYRDMAKWHHTRISLSNGVLADERFAEVELMIASQGMTLWQDISLYIPLDHSMNSNDETDHDMDLIPITQGAVCQMLEEKSYNRIRLRLDMNHQLHKFRDPEFLRYFISPGDGVQLSYILHHCNLSVEHKITLAYAISRSCWQFYDFNLMHARWTSDSIWFMPLDNHNKNQIPLRAYVSIPFHQQDQSLAEYLETGDYTHRYPRILFLGIILLEIGLGKSLGIEPFETSNLSLVAHTNKAHSKAQMRLNEFKKISWTDFSYKDVFVEAVEKCMDSRNFDDMHKTQKRRRRRFHSISKQPLTANTSIPKERRIALYRKVVAPLCWLANVGFEASREVPLITVQNLQRPKSTVLEDETTRAFWTSVKDPAFDTTNSVSQAGSWIDRLKVISGYVLRCQRLAKVTTRIRVAILDTGCNRDIPIFQNATISDCFKDWKDFAADSQISVDTFGHGTFMACLLLQVAPIVDLYIARIAVAQDQLELSEDNVVQAIKHAGFTWKADVVSMSFSFPKPSVAISSAIESVMRKSEKPIIFLGSAGNSSSDRGEAFPARHPDVIPIYATDHQGAFLRSNPTRSGDGPRVLGTYGDNIPELIYAEMKQFFPLGDFSPGTSVSTAVAAGIVAMMLSYSAALPALIQATLFEEILEKLRTPKGMTNMLRVMSQNTDHRGDFVNPIRFWSDKSKDKEVFLAICKALAE